MIPQIKNKNLKMKQFFPNLFNAEANNSSLSKYFNKNSSPIIGDENLNHIFEESIQNEKENHFCQKNLRYIEENNDTFINCDKCNRFVCSACLEICHKDCKLNRVKDEFENHVKLFYSFCECKHKQKIILQSCK